MEDVPINTPQYQGAVFHPFRDKDEAVPGQNVLFIYQPELYFSSQVIRIIRIAAEKPDYFVRIMCGRPGYMRRWP